MISGNHVLFSDNCRKLYLPISIQDESKKQRYLDTYNVRVVSLSVGVQISLVVMGWNKKYWVTMIVQYCTQFWF